MTQRRGKSGWGVSAIERGWTLIEILVVVAVLAVLLALLLPCLNAAREQGRRAVCKARLRQLYYAWNQYADDHEGRLVYCLTWDPQIYLTPPRESTPWLLGRASLSKPVEALSREDWKAMLSQGSLWPYVRDVDVYGCPACPSQLRISVNSSGVMDIVKAPVRLSYSIGASLGTDKPPQTIADLPAAMQGHLYVSRLQEIAHPAPGARMVFICEGDLRAMYAVFYDEPRWNSPPPVYHGDGTAVSFADGHCEYWKWRDPATRKLGRLARDDFGQYAAATGTDLTLMPGNTDLERVQRALWGRLGYAVGAK
jgi:prepilin-type N-terminal cleavage/methylation domain-containing protein/prepilin-type processing-associated H-X9-DG protein